MVLAVHRDATGIGGYGREEGGVRNAEPHFLPFHIATGMQGARILIHAGEQWITARFSPVRSRHSDEKKKRHCRPYRPAMPLGTGHTAQGECETGRNPEN